MADMAVRFTIQSKFVSSLDAADTERLPPSFATAQEAALALARCLGPVGSAAHAEVIKPLTEEDITHCMERTDNGEAFGGLFDGGYVRRVGACEDVRLPQLYSCGGSARAHVSHRAGG